MQWSANSGPRAGCGPRPRRGSIRPADTFREINLMQCICECYAFLGEIIKKIRSLRIFMIGGKVEINGVKGSLDKVFTFNPSTLSFDLMAERVPFKVQGSMQLVQVDNRILFLSGYHWVGTQKQPIDHIYEMDPKTGLWKDMGFKTPDALKSPQFVIPFNQ